MLGQVGPLKDLVFALALCSWAGLAAALLGVRGFRLTGYVDHAVAFLVVAALTRLTFTLVETRWQIAAFAAVAALCAAGELGRDGLGGAAGRWLASMLGVLVGAVLMRELVHHWLERWL